MTVVHSAPRITSNEGVKDALSTALGDMLVEAHEEHGEILFTVARDRIEDALRLLRDEHEYQQLMEIAGVDYPQRTERFEVVYMLLSVTKNHRVMVKVTASEKTPVPTVTTLWPNAGWLEREVFDMYGVLFDGNTDLRRILTDYGFEGHPFRKDFPLTGYIELRYSEEEKRVVYEPVDLPQDLRRFDFMSPWEGADYVLPGDEKAAKAPPSPQVDEPKVTPGPGISGAGEPTDSKANERHGFVAAEPFEPVFDYARDAILRSHEESLARLRRDRVDILLAHDIGELTHGTENKRHMRTFLDSGYGAMAELKRVGAIDAIGLGVNEAEVCLYLLERVELDVILLAGRYTLLDRRAADELLPLCAERGVKVVIGGPYNSGILAQPTALQRDPRFDYERPPEAILARAEALERLCLAHGIELGAAALQFPLRHPAVASVIPGIVGRAQVEETVARLAIDVPEDLWTELEQGTAA